MGQEDNYFESEKFEQNLLRTSHVSQDMKSARLFYRGLKDSVTTQEVQSLGLL